MRFIYTLGIHIYGLLILCASLFYPKARALYKGRKNTWRNIKTYIRSEHSRVYWFHAASLGEFEQGRPLIESMKKEDPSCYIILTFFSPSGYEVRKNYSFADKIVYLPSDTPANARRWLAQIRPDATFFIKYEYWYNYLQALNASASKVYFVSAKFRPSQYFFKAWGKWFLAQLAKVSAFFVQDELSEKLLRLHGISQVYLSGDTRLDRVCSVKEEDRVFPWAETFSHNRFVCVAGSTWPQDEPLLEYCLRQSKDQVALMVVPHEIDKAHIRKIESLFADYACTTLSQMEASAYVGIEKIQVLIVDQMGYLSYLYRYGQMAYIGGGFGTGIHNVLEAAVYEIPVFFGPKYHKFSEAVSLVEEGGAVSVENKEQAWQIWREWSESMSLRKKASESALKYIKKNKGALSFIQEKIKTWSILSVCFLLCVLGMNQDLYSESLAEKSNDTINLYSEEPYIGDTVNETLSRKKIAKILTRYNTGSTYYYYYHPFQTEIPAMRPIDTGMEMIQRINPVYAGSEFRADRGVLGMPDQLIEYELPSNFGFSYGVDPFDSWRYTLENTPFYQTKVAYTVMSYKNNFGKEDLFSIKHSQNVAKGLNFTIDYQTMQMPDNKAQYFTNAKVRHHHLRLYGNYMTPDARYVLQFGWLRNSVMIGENGGMQTDSLYTKNLEKNHLLIPVNLQDGARQWKENSYFLKQSVRFYGYFSHIFNLNQYRSSYQDKSKSADSFYQHFYINPTQTQDTNRILKMSNQLFYSTYDFESTDAKFPVQALVGGRNEYMQIKDMFTKTEIVQWFGFARLRFLWQKRFLIDAYYEQAWNGYNNGDFQTYAEFAYLRKDTLDYSVRRDGLRLRAGMMQSQADWVKHRYMSNHFYFNNTFTPEKQLYAELSFRWKGWEAQAGYYMRNDYVQWLETGPKQIEEGFSIMKLLLAKNFRFRWVGWENRLLLQYTDKPQFCHLPLFSLKESIYAIIPVKKIAMLYVGLDIYYNTGYYGDGYMPALGIYYWQDKVKTGNYLVADVFINFQVKTFTLFVRGSHINQGLFGYNTMATPHYGIANRAVQFGLSWRFMD